MGTLFSDDFSGISTGANIDEDSNWVIHSNGSATAKEASGRARLTSIGGTNPSRVTIEPVYSGSDLKSGLRFSLKKGPTGLSFFDYDHFVLGVRADHFDTTSTPSSPWDQNFPYRGWYFYFYPWRDATLYLYRANSGAAGTSLASATSYMPGWGTSTDMEFRFEWEKTSTSPDYWTFRARQWNGTEPGTWGINYQDTAPGVHDDKTSGKWLFSINHIFGTTANQDMDIDNVVITDLSTTQQGDAHFTVDVAQTAEAGVRLRAAVAHTVDVAQQATATVGGDVYADVSFTVDIDQQAAGSVPLVHISGQAPLTIGATGAPTASRFIVPDPGAGETLPSGYAAPIGTYDQDVVYDGVNNRVRAWEPVGTHSGAVIINLVGGGFVTSVYNSPGEWVKRYVSMGVTVASFQYGSALPPPADPWPDPRDDAETAVAWAQSEWPGKTLILVGHSAGGYLAELTAASQDLPVVAMSGWSDWTHYQANESGFGSMATARNTLFADETVPGTPPVAADPAFDTNTENVYLITGDDDAVLNPLVMTKTADDLAALGVQVHVDYVDSGPTSAYHRDHEPYYGFNRASLDQWLIDQGAALTVTIGVAQTAPVTMGATGTIRHRTHASVSYTLDVDQSAAGGVTIPGSVAHTVDVDQQAAGTVTGQISGEVHHTVDVDQQAAGTLSVGASVAHTTDIDQGLSGSVTVGAAVAHTVDIDQTVDGAVTVAGSVAHTVDIDQSADGSVTEAVHQGEVSFTVDLDQQAAGSVTLSASVAHATDVDQTVSATVRRGATVAHTVDVDQSVNGSATLAATVSHTLDVDQSAAAILGLAATVSHTIDVDQSAAGSLSGFSVARFTIDVDQQTAATVAHTGVVAHTVDVDETVTGSVTRDATVAHTTTVGLTAAATVRRGATVTHTVEIDQTAAGAVSGVDSGAVHHTIDIDQQTTGTVTSRGTVAHTLDIECTATGTVRRRAAVHCTIDIDQQTTGTVTGTNPVVAFTVNIGQTANGTGGTTPLYVPVRAIGLRPLWRPSRATSRWTVGTPN